MKPPLSRLSLILVLPAALLLGNCAPQSGAVPAHRPPVSGGAAVYCLLQDAHFAPLSDGEVGATARSAADLMPPVIVTATRDPVGSLDEWPSCKAVAEINVARVLSYPSPPNRRPPEDQLAAWLRSLR